MSNVLKDQEAILKKLGIEKLNPMQEEARVAIPTSSEIVLLSPTGTGKTLAFLLPLIGELDTNCNLVQAIILAPSRELVIQIEGVARSMGTGFKINAVYGGRPFSKDKTELQHPPAILIGTPGRVADHLRRDSFSTDRIGFFVLDEFDKSLEVGFEKQMLEITEALYKVRKKILTSATEEVVIPPFIGLRNPKYLNYLKGGVPQLKVKTIISPTKDKLATLVDALCHLGDVPGIIFCNFKGSIQRVSDYLAQNRIEHGCFYGDMEQVDRERALLKFRNGTHQLLVATDLASRGIDVPEIKFIIHYHLPNRKQEFIHRNGRTARMNSRGTAYVLKIENEELPEFIPNYAVQKLKIAGMPTPSAWKTLFISGGRKDKISKGDVVGFVLKIGGLKKEELGNIELKQECAFVAIPTSKVVELVQKLDNQRLKKRKVRVHLV